MLYLDINEEKTLAFEVEINGVGCDEICGKVRLEYNDVEYGFPAVIEEGKITTVIMPLKELFPDIKNGTTLNAKLELNTDKYYFSPWQGQIKVQAPVSVEAKIIEDKNEQKEKMAIKASIVSEEKKVPLVEKKLKPVSKKKTIKETVNNTKGWSKEKLKNITEEDMIEYMKRAGTSNPRIQELLLQEARNNVKKKGNLEVFKYIVRTLKKK